MSNPDHPATKKSLLTGKVAIITGGGGVLGVEMAKTLAANGADVAILDIKEESAMEVADLIKKAGGSAIGIACDVLDKTTLQKANSIVRAKWNAVDILINAAGGNHPTGTTSEAVLLDEHLNDPSITTFFDLEKEGIEFVFNLNFLSCLLASQVFGRDMIGREGACIINISSMNAFRPLTKIPAYSAAKASVSNFTQWLAVHFAKAGIRVNALAPGFFLTEQNRSLLTESDGSLTERGEQIISHTPIGRFGRAEDLNSSLIWLCDPGSAFVTGVVVPVDGGFSAYSGI